jgi:hypothetical protein
MNWVGFEIALDRWIPFSFSLPCMYYFLRRAYVLRTYLGPLIAILVMPNHSLSVIFC